MNKLFKGLLICAFSIICALSVVACSKTVTPGGDTPTESQQHVCQFENWETKKDATCEEDGEEIGYCSCGKTSVREIPSVGHSYKDGEVLTPSTCEEHGLMQIVCENCGNESQKELPLAEHEDETIIEEPTCSEQGREYQKCVECGRETNVTVIEKVPHDLIEEIYGNAMRAAATCEQPTSYWKTCSDCEAISSTVYFTVGEVSDHRPASPYECAHTYCIDCKADIEPTKDHTFGEWVEVGASSCSATVVKFHACEDCGYIEDELGLNHAVTHHNIAFEETPATCEVDGSFVVYCTNCDFETVVVYDALGHLYDWEVDSNGHRQVCLREGCGSVINDSAHVSSGAATCEKDEVCKVCNYLMKGKLHHDWLSLEDKDATCTENGYINAKECQNCHKVIKTTIYGGHIFEYITGYSATCEEDGLKTHKHCVKCLNNYDLTGNLLTDVVIIAPGHNYSTDWCYDSENHYKECSVCHDKKEVGAHVSSGEATETKAEVCLDCGYEITPKKGHKHTYEQTVVAPTCQRMGYTLNTCSSCGYSHKSDYTDKAQHSYGDEYIVQELSCEQDEVVEKECSECHTKSRRVTKNAPGHNPSDWITEREATCTADGVARRYCQNENCGKLLDELKLTKTGHSYEEVDRQDATCEEDGYAKYECENCGDDYTIVLYALKHKDGVWKIEKDATCHEDGYKVKYCQRSGCGKELDRDVIPAKGHDYNSKWTVVEDATCEEDGLEIQYCQRKGCGEKLDERAISAKGHLESDWIIDKEATCEEDGAKHTICEREGCGVIVSTDVIPALGHDYNSKWTVVEDATCEEDGLEVQYCQRKDCGEKLGERAISAKGHLESDWIIDKDATCYESGEKHTICEREGCGVTVSTDVIPAKGHDFNSEWTVVEDATCEEEGLKEQYCQRENCGEKIDEAVISKKGHLESDWIIDKDATCYDGGEKHTICEREGCGITLSTDVIPAKGHDYNSKWTVVEDATCEEEGYKIQYCQRENCGEKLNESVIPAKGHNYTWRVEKPATCHEDGHKVKYCQREGCGEELDREDIPALGHDYDSEWTITKKATCEEDGLKEQYCERECCGEKLDEKVVPKLGHEEEWRVEKPATCSEDGLRVKYCSRPDCGIILDEEIIPAEHGDKEWKTIQEVTCEEDGYRVLHCIKCGEKLDEEHTPSLGHKISKEYTYDEFYHYYECENGCGKIFNEEEHSYSQELHESKKEEDGKIIYSAYIEFTCHCGYSHDSETVTNTTHQSVVAINPVAPTCTEVGYTVGLKCGVEGCDEIFLEPTEIPALGHRFVNGKCLRCGEEQKTEQITIFIEMHFPSGEVWKDYDYPDEGHTLYSYFKTWDMFDEEIADIYYLEINGEVRDTKDVYSYVLNNGDRFVVKFGKTDTEETPDDSVYIVAFSNKKSGSQNIVVFFADRILTVKEFYEYAGIERDKVNAIFVGNAQITDENYSLGQHTDQIEIYYSEEFMPRTFATVEVYSIEEGNPVQTVEFLVSLDQKPITFNNLAIVFGYAYAKDFVERSDVTQNGKVVKENQSINSGDLIVVTGKNSSGNEEPIEEFVTIEYACEFADGEEYFGTITLIKYMGLYDFIDKLCEGAFWAPMLFADIESASYNDIGIDPYAFVFEEDGNLRVKFATFNSEIETIWLNLEIEYANGDKDKSPIEFISGRSFEDLMKWICTSDAWKEMFDDVRELYVNGSLVDKHSFVFTENCDVRIIFDTFAPPVQTGFEVEYVVFDLDNQLVTEGNVYTENVYLVEFISREIGLTDAAIVNIKEIHVNGGIVKDYYNFIIQEDCSIKIYIDIKQGDSDKNVVTVEGFDANGNYTGTMISFEIDGDQITLRELIELNTPFKYEEFIESEGGRFYRDGEELYAESIIYARSVIQFIYSKVEQDKEQIEIYYVSEHYNGYLTVPFGIDLCIFFEKYAPHAYVYHTFYEFVEHGEIIVNGKVHYSGEYILSNGDNVNYHHRGSNKCDGDHVWNENGYCANCGTQCSHDAMAEGSPCPDCGYKPFFFHEYEIMLYFGNWDGMDSFMESGMRTTWTKLETYEPNVTLSMILEDNGDGTYMVREYIERAYSCGYDFIWTVDGNRVSESQTIRDRATIVGVLSRVKIETISITVSSEDFGSKTYYYEYPVRVNTVFERFLADLGLENGNFYYSVSDGSLNAEGELAIGNCSITCNENRNLLRYQIIDENGYGEWQEFWYKASKRPTVRSFANEIGLSLNNYFAYYGSVQLVEEDFLYESVTFLKKNVKQSSYEITIIYQESRYSEKITYTTSYEEVMSLSEIINRGICEDENGASMSIFVDFNRHVCLVDSYVVGSKNNDPYWEINNFLIYNDCTIEIKPATIYYVEIKAGYEYYSNHVLSDRNLTGEEILERVDLLDEVDGLIFFVCDMQYSAEEFLSMTISGFGEEMDMINIRIVKGSVRAWVELTDEMGMTHGERFEDFCKLSLDLIYILDKVDGCAGIINLPNGEQIEFSESAFPLTFDSDYWYQEGDFWYSEYTIILTATTFRVSVSIDDQYLGERILQKGDYTLEQILSQFGEYKVADYNWNISAHNGEWVDPNGIINKGVSIYGYDARPRVIVEVPGMQYVIYHTSALTLQDVFYAIREKYGVEYKYEDYAWNYSLNVIVANPGETVYVQGKILTKVTVTFFSQYGMVEHVWDENGNSAYVYERDSYWDYPSVDLSSCYGLMEVEDGSWMYYGEEGTRLVTCVADLFEIGKEKIELWAVVNLIEEKLVGTYALDSNNAIAIIGKDRTITYRDENGVLFTSNYEVVESSMSFALIINDYGIYIEGLFLQEYYKVNEDRIIIFVYTPYGDYRFEDTSGLEGLKNTLVIDVVYNVYNEIVEEMTYGNVYYVYMSEPSLHGKIS